MKLPYSRSLPLFNVLLKAQASKRMHILQQFPAYVVDDLIEILYNVVLGKVDIGKKVTQLKRHKNALLNIVHAKGKRGKRQVFYKQSGGFLGALLPLIPLIASTIGGLFSKQT